MTHTVALDATVQSAIVTTLGAIIVALIGVTLEVLRRHNKKLGAVREQIQNSHTTNLREDVDRLLIGVDQLLDGQGRQDELLREHGRDIGGLRQEMRHERAERIDVERRLDALKHDT